MTHGECKDRNFAGDLTVSILLSVLNFEHPFVMFTTLILSLCGHNSKSDVERYNQRPLDSNVGQLHVC